MKTRNLKTLIAFVVATSSLLGSIWPLQAADSSREKKTTRPNIIIIFIDDMGYGDIGPFGNKVNQTPNLDRMAAEGNKLRAFYVANTACTPSRAALMTGTYAHRIGMDGMVCFPGEDRGLNPEEITIAEMLKEKGYATGCFGKWHLGDQREFLPLAQGFDEYFGIPYSNDMWPGNARGNPITDRGPYEPLPVIRGNDAVAYVADGADQSLLCEVITDEAIKFVRRNKDKPFFCYLPHAYVHSPRYARPGIMRKAGGNPDRANIEEVDTSVGRILKTLRELSIAKNTLVLFTSDNGGAEGMSMGPLRGGKPGPKYEGHMRVPTIAWWPATIPAGVVTDEIAVTTDLMTSLAKLTGATLPQDRTIDGKDALNVLLGKPGAKSPHDILYYEVDAVRRGKWKLVRVGKRRELYDLEKDLGERKNISKKHPKITNELDALLASHAKRTAADTRSAGFVNRAKPILKEVGDLPRLRELIGKPKTKAANENIAPGVTSSNQSPAARRKAPDVLFIAIDDMNDWTTLFDKSNPIQTPNLERLAARGCFFTRAYCASPGCNASRTAIMTGLRPTSSGVYGNAEAWREKMPNVVTLPQYFERMGGYATRGAGKIFHHGKSGADRPNDPSFQVFFKKLKIRGPGPSNNYNGYRKPNNPRLGEVAFDWGVHDRKMIDVDMCEWVEARMEKKWNKPLFLAAGIFNPHLPFYAPKETFARYPLEKTVMPVMKKGDLNDVGEIAKRMVRKEFWIYDNTSAKEPGSPGSLQRMVQCYQAAADYADQMVGRLLDKLDETGRAENTIIVLWSDHGYHLGDKETCVKFTLWEKANRVPFIIVAPGVAEPGTRCDRPVGLIDIYPTLVELAGLPAKANNDGTSLVPLMKDPSRTWHPALMNESPGNHAVRSDRWRYISYRDGSEELYDHDNDPWEHDNLAGDPKHAGIIAELRTWLPETEAPGDGATHLLHSPAPAGAGLRVSGYSTDLNTSGKKIEPRTVGKKLPVAKPEVRKKNDQEKADNIAKLEPEKPNILIIFTDDQGYADLACYGNTKNKTPRLDQLAAEGTKFTSFYAQAVCGPSRSALLTGRYPIRSKGWMMPASETTFAELALEAGYQTACIGKWDVSNRKPIIERMPNAQGFDYYFGALGANDDGIVHFHENNTPAGSTTDMASLTRLYTDKSIDFLENRRDAERPFLLYLSHTMMHTVIDASPEFKGNSEGGLYGDVVEEFDHETGRLLDTLDDLGLTDNTLVIYTSDNGPWNQPKYTLWKMGIVLDKNTKKQPSDWFMPKHTIFWGEAGPLRNGKGSPYEGGYRAPCIVRWPGKVPAGRVNDAIFASIDFLPTFATLAGYRVPTDRVIDGLDQTALLFGERETGRNSFYFDRSGVRLGKWKYLKRDAFFHGYAVEDDRPAVAELYDLETDLGETNNLAGKFPEKVGELTKRMKRIEANVP